MKYKSNMARFHIQNKKMRDISKKINKNFKQLRANLQISMQHQQNTCFLLCFPSVILQLAGAQPEHFSKKCMQC